MKTNLQTIANCASALNKLAGIDLGSPKENYRFMEVINKAQSESKKFIELQRGIVEKYRDSEQKEDIYIPVESIESFNREMQEAGEIAVELDWDAVDCSIHLLNGFTANDMQCLDGVFINIKGE